MIRTLILAATALTAPLAAAAATASADYVLTNAQIYTEDPGRRTVQALAVKDGKIIYVGDAKGAEAFMAPGVRLENARRPAGVARIGRRPHPSRRHRRPGCLQSGQPSGEPRRVARFRARLHRQIPNPGRRSG